MDSADNGRYQQIEVHKIIILLLLVRYTHEMTGADLTSAVANGFMVVTRTNGSATTAFLLTGCQFEIRK